MGKLADLLATQCCSALMGGEVKRKLVDEISALEEAHEAAKAELVASALQLAETEAECITRCKDIFLRVYTGEYPEQAWLQLCAELGQEL